MIGYFILAHHRPDALLDLVDAIYTEEDAYVISLNGTVAPEFRHSLLWLQKIDNIRLMINRGINWAGASMLEAVLQGMRVLIEDFPHIRHFMNLTGECFPVRSRFELGRYLEARPGMNFVLAHELKETFDDPRGGLPEALLASPSYSPRDPQVERILVNVLDRPAEISRREENRFVADPWLYFSYNAATRIFCFNHDRPAAAEVCLSHAPEFFLSARKHFDKKYSRFWQKFPCTLTRDFCEFVLNDELSFTVYDHLRNSLMPEEAFFGTIIRNSPFRDRHISQSLTFDEPGKAREIDADDIQAIQEGDYFFARKFTVKSDSVKLYYKRLLGDRRLPRPVYSSEVGEARVRSKIFSILTANDRVWWRFSRFSENPENFSATVQLQSGGRIAGYSHPNERTWHLDEATPALEFRSDAGTTTTAFSSFAVSRNGNIYLFGEFRLGQGVIHYLESELSEHFRRALDLDEALNWLLDNRWLRTDAGDLSTGLAPTTVPSQSRRPDAEAWAELVRSEPRFTLPKFAELRCIIDGRDTESVNRGSVPGHEGPKYWLTDFGILISNIADLEFVAISQGLFDSYQIALFGEGRNFRGKHCAVCLRSDTLLLDSEAESRDLDPLRQ